MTKPLLSMLLCVFLAASFPCKAQEIEPTIPLEEATTVISEEKSAIEPDSEEKEGDKETKKRKKKDKPQKNKKDTDKSNDTGEGNDLHATVNELMDTIKTIKTQLLFYRHENDSLKQDLAELLPFRIELLKSLCRGIDVIETKPFSSITQDSIDSIRNRIKPFLSSSPELTANDLRLQQLSDSKRKFDSFATSLRTKPYGEELMKEYREFESEFSNNKTESQQKEISALKKQMYTYPTLIPEFINVIDEFQLQLEYARNHNDLTEAKDMAKVTVNMNDNFISAKEAMKQIGYMDNLLGEYLALLSGTNPLDERIIKIEETVATMKEALPKASKK